MIAYIQTIYKRKKDNSNDMFSLRLVEGRKHNPYGIAWIIGLPRRRAMVYYSQQEHVEPLRFSINLELISL